MTEPAAAQLDEAGEREWALLHDQFDLADGFWIGFMFSPAYTAPQAMAERVERKLQPAGHALRRWQVTGDPVALRDLPSQVVAAARESTADCLWVEALENDLGDRPPETSWTTVWSECLMRLNERREVFVRHHRGALMVVAPPWVKPLVWERAPDLWAFRAIVVELVAGVSLAKPTLSRDSLSSLAEASLSVADTTALHDGERALEGAGRFTEAGGVMSAAAVAVRHGRLDKARELIVWALALPRDHKTPRRSVALCLSFLGALESKIGDVPAAVDHLTQARSMEDALDDEEAWRVSAMLAILLLRLDDHARALDAAAHALLISRREHAAHPRLQPGQRLLESLWLVGELKLRLDHIADAEAVRTEAVTHARDLVVRFGEKAALSRGLRDALFALGEVQDRRGDLRAAANSYEEAVQIARAICSREGESAASLMELSPILSSLAVVYKLMGREEDATPILDELVVIARRLSPPNDSPSQT